MKEFQEEEGQIVIYGAREHNLKNIDLTIPRNSLTVITGLSGWEIVSGFRYDICRRTA